MTGNVKIYIREQCIITTVACFFLKRIKKIAEKQLLVLFSFFHHNVYPLK
jgi:hypothetical protein